MVLAGSSQPHSLVHRQLCFNSQKTKFFMREVLQLGAASVGCYPNNFLPIQNCAEQISQSCTLQETCTLSKEQAADVFDSYVLAFCAYQLLFSMYRRLPWSCQEQLLVLSQLSFPQLLFAFCFAAGEHRAATELYWQKLWHRDYHHKGS